MKSVNELMESYAYFLLKCARMADDKFKYSTKEADQKLVQQAFVEYLTTHAHHFDIRLMELAQEYAKKELPKENDGQSIERVVRDHVDDIMDCVYNHPNKRNRDIVRESVISTLMTRGFLQDMMKVVRNKVKVRVKDRVKDELSEEVRSFRLEEPKPAMPAGDLGTRALLVHE